MRITIHAMLLAAASAFLIAQTAAAIGTSSGGVSQFSVVPAEFAAAIQEEGFALAPVDLSQVAGLSAPFFVSGENSTQSIGFFGDTVESSTDCRQIGGSSGVGYVYPSCLRSQNTLQIQFTNTIHAVSFKLHDLDSAGTDVEKLVAKSPGTDPDKFVVSTFDANGILIESHSVPSRQMQGNDGFLGIVSAKLFQSVVIAPTNATNWMFTDLTADQGRLNKGD